MSNPNLQAAQFDDYGYADVHDGTPHADNRRRMTIAMGNYPVAWDRPAEEKITTEHLDPRSLAPTQSYITKDKHDALRQPGVDVSHAPIHVVRAGGQNLIRDGHHRAHLAAEQGRPVLAQVKDIDRNGRF